MLLEYVMNFASSTCTTMSLEVRIENDVARHVYEKAGFTYGGVRKLLWRRRGCKSMWVSLKMCESIILSIETSCDETAASVIKDGKEILSNEVVTDDDT